MEHRPTPYDLVFADLADERFTRIRATLAERQADPRDRDAFLMVPEAVTIIRDLRPDEGVGEGIEQLAALVHHGYLFWDANMPVLLVPSGRLGALLGADPAPGDVPPPAALYAQLPERRIWATVVPGEPAEPLDGCFVHAVDDELRVLGVFGIRPDRQGFSVVESAGRRPERLAREDGTAPFAPNLPGGEAAALHSLVGIEELLELGWRTWTA